MGRVFICKTRIFYAHGNTSNPHYDIAVMRLVQQREANTMIKREAKGDGMWW